MHNAGKTSLLLLFLTTGLANAAPFALPQGNVGLGDSGSFLTSGVGNALKAIPAQVGNTFSKSAEKLGKSGLGGSGGDEEDEEIEDEDDDEDEDEDDIIQGPFEDEVDDNGTATDTQGSGVEGQPDADNQTQTPNRENLNSDSGSEAGINATTPTPGEPEVTPAIQPDVTTLNITRRAEGIAQSAKANLVARKPQAGGLGSLLSNVVGGLGLEAIQNLAEKKDKDRKTTTSAPSSTVPANSSTIATTSNSVPTAIAITDAAVKFITITVTPVITTRAPTALANTATATPIRFKSKAPKPKSLPPAPSKNRRAAGPGAGGLGGLPLDSLDGVLPVSQLKSVTEQIVSTGNQAASKRSLFNSLPAVPEEFPEQLPLVNDVTPNKLPIPGVKEFTIKKVTLSRSKRGLLPPIGLDRVGLDDGISLQDIAPSDLPIPGLNPKKEETEEKKPEESTKTPEKEQEDTSDDTEEELDGIGKLIEDKVEENKKESKEDKEKAEIDPTFGLDQVKKVGEQANLENLGVSGLLANAASPKALTT